MPDDSHLVLAFFDTEAAADSAAVALKTWARDNRRVRLEAVGVLAKDERGEVKVQKLGPREGRRGIGIGAVLGIVAGIATGGLSLAEGALIGGAGGGVVGSFFHRGLGMTDDDATRIASRLDAGHAAVGALVPQNQAPAISRELAELGGEAEVHEVAADDIAKVSAGSAC